MSKINSKEFKAPGRRRHGGGPMAGGGIGQPVEKARDFKGNMKKLLLELKPFRAQLIIVIIFASLSTVFGIATPKIMGNGTTKLADGFMDIVKGVPGAKIDFEYIGMIVLVLLGLYVISALFNYVQQYIMAGVSQKIVYNLREKVNQKLARLPLKYFDSKTHGEILSRVTNDIDTISTTLQQSMTQMITAVLALIGILIMMLSISGWMTLIALVTLPLSMLITTFIAKFSQKQFAGQQKTLGELNGHVEEIYTGWSIVKAYGKERQSIDKFDEVNKQLYVHAWKAQFVSGVIMPLLNFVGSIGYVFICVVGGIFASGRSLSIGDIQSFIIYSKQFTQPIVQTANIANLLQSTVAAAERVFDLLEEEEQLSETDSPKTLPHPQGKVEFKHVKFGYTENILMNDLNVTANPGKTVAIVGPTGAGKTTLVNLLMRFYETGGGDITVDGVSIYDMRRSDLRAMFGMVLQDTWLFHGTIRENIAYGRDGATEEQVTAAAKSAHAHHFIRTLEHGYDTVINEEATNISSGQKQLLTIARAILADPDILILDEATSSVDTRTEVLIQRGMNKLMRGRTSFVIAHRLSTIRDADLILVMNDGDIIEQGAHAELMEQDGFYAELYNSQFVRA